MATLTGPLCGESMIGSCFIVEDLKLSDEYIESTKD